MADLVMQSADRSARPTASETRYGVPPGSADKFRHVIGLVRSNPWAIRPEKLAAIDEALTARIEQGPPSDLELRERIGETPAKRRYRVEGGVALIPIFGTISKRADFFTRASGGTSTEQLEADIKAALADPEVKALLFDCDSPGGSAHGPLQAANLIRRARGQKPIIALANDDMCSACYWIASAADRVLVTETATVGSIGVVAIHQERSTAEGRYGIKTTVLTAGRYKAAGNPYEPLSDDSRAVLQSRLDYIYTLFIEGVAANRGVPPAEVVERMADGRVFLGRQAIAAGLADDIATLEGALDLARSAATDRTTFFVKGIPMPDSSAPATGPVETKPTNPPPAPTNQPTAPATGPAPAAAAPAASPTAPPAAPPALSAADVARATADAIAAERVRAKEIRELCAAAGSTSAAAYIDQGLAVTEVRAKLLDELVKARATIGTDAAGDAPPAVDHEARCRSEYAASRGAYERLKVSEAEYIASRKVDLGLASLPDPFARKATSAA